MEVSQNTERTVENILEYQVARTPEVVEDIRPGVIVAAKRGGYFYVYLRPCGEHFKFFPFHPEKGLGKVESVPLDKLEVVPLDNSFRALLLKMHSEELDILRRVILTKEVPI